MHACTRIAGQVRKRRTASKPLETESLRKYHTILRFPSSLLFPRTLLFLLFLRLSIFFNGSIPKRLRLSPIPDRSVLDLSQTHSVSPPTRVN